MNKKWVVRLLLSLAALALVIGILRTRYGNKLFYKHVFTDTEKHVSFAYPNHWNLSTGGSNPYLVATVTSPDISEYTPSFNVTTEKVSTGMSLDDYVAQTVKQLKDVIADFTQESMTNTVVDGQDARKLIFHGTYMNQAFSWEQIYTMKNHSVYVMTYLAPSGLFHTQKDDIEGVFTTFSIN